MLNAYMKFTKTDSKTEPHRTVQRMKKAQHIDKKCFINHNECNRQKSMSEKRVEIEIPQSTTKRHSLFISRTFSH